jgi:large subunit ribosomal protein L13
MKTFSAKPDAVRRDWYVVDASGKTLGRLATELARRLRGKHKPEFTPHVDTGDYIVVINAGKVRVTGNKLEDKVYYHHTGYIGHMKSETLGKRCSARPSRSSKRRSRACCPRTSLGRQMLKKLRIFPGANTLTRPSSPRRWRSDPGRNEYEHRHELRHRPAQDLDRARLPAPGQGRDHGQQQAARRVLRP